MPIDPTLMSIIVCPACHGTLELGTAAAEESAGEPASETLTCTDCSLVYPVRGGIPVLLVDEASSGS